MVSNRQIAFALVVILFAVGCMAPGPERLVLPEMTYTPALSEVDYSIAWTITTESPSSGRTDSFLMPVGTAGLLVFPSLDVSEAQLLSEADQAKLAGLIINTTDSSRGVGMCVGEIRFLGAEFRSSPNKPNQYWVTVSVSVKAGEEVVLRHEERYWSHAPLTGEASRLATPQSAKRSLARQVLDSVWFLFGTKAPKELSRCAL